MFLPKKVLALAASVLVAVSAATLAQNGSPGQALVIPGTIEWLEKSDVTALKDGVINKIEYQVGRRVLEGKEIGGLHDELARFAVVKAKLQAENSGEITKGMAQRKLAIAELARIKRLEFRGPGITSASEKEKAEAELAVADAMVQIAQENQAVYKADYDAAVQVVHDHKIFAPFSGVIIDRMKNPGEAVHSNEAVVRIGRTDTLRVIGWLPLDVAGQIKGNEPVEVRVIIEGSAHPIQNKKFSGRITAVSREINTTRTTDVQVLADVYNDEDADSNLHLLAGMKVEMSVRLGEQAPAPPKVAVKTPR